MKAWVMHDFTGITGLRLAEVPDPVPQAGEVLLRVEYAALNPADRYLAERQYPANPSLPHILGRDGAGTVVQPGPGTSGHPVGARRLILRGEVGGDRPGTFAELVCVPEASLVEPPAGWTVQESAGAALVYLTAYQALTMWGDLPERFVVLVTGATGGVGVASVQLACALGCTVVGLSRSSQKSKRLEELGAIATLNPKDSSWPKDLKAFLAPRRVGLAIDNIGGPLLPQVIDTLGDQGKVSVVGRLAGPVPNFNTATLFFRRVRIGGVAVGAYTPTESRAAWHEVVRLMSRSGARPISDSVFPFPELLRAFGRLGEGPMGKVLLQVSAA